MWKTVAFLNIGLGGMHYTSTAEDQVLFIRVKFQLFLLNDEYHSCNWIYAIVCYCSKEYETVAQQGVKTWKCSRFGLIYEYKDKPAFPPPLIVISLIWRCYKDCCRGKFSLYQRWKYLEFANVA